jgi:hypothetical protein
MSVENYEILYFENICLDICLCSCLFIEAQEQHALLDYISSCMFHIGVLFNPPGGVNSVYFLILHWYVWCILSFVHFCTEYTPYMFSHHSRFLGVHRGWDGGMIGTIGRGKLDKGMTEARGRSIFPRLHTITSVTTWSHGCARYNIWL